MRGTLGVAAAMRLLLGPAMPMTVAPVLAVPAPSLVGPSALTVIGAAAFGESGRAAGVAVTAPFVLRPRRLGSPPMGALAAVAGAILVAILLAFGRRPVVSAVTLLAGVAPAMIAAGVVAGRVFVVVARPFRYAVAVDFVHGLRIVGSGAPRRGARAGLRSRWARVRTA
jgi:ABC-type cobalamin transport system permease subunit